MTQEQKQLLLVDLSARLPYGVKIQCINSDNETVIEKLFTIGIEEDSFDCNLIEYVSVKPYLFPLSSMTEEQNLELEIITGETIGFDAYSLHDFTGYSEISLSKTLEIIQWCYGNHFDINGLIPMGLAIDCTNLNIY